MNYINKFQRDMTFDDDNIEIAPRIDKNKVRDDKINIILDRKESVLDKVEDFLSGKSKLSI